MELESTLSECALLERNDPSVVALRSFYGPTLIASPLSVPLPPPRSDIYLCAPSVALDRAGVVSILNDPRVCSFLSSPPYPCTSGDADAWNAKQVRGCAETLDELRTPSTRWTSTCPWKSLRVRDERASDGWRMIGSVDLNRWQYLEVGDNSARKHLVEVNEARPPGDPDIVHGFGFYLDPAYHGRGIVTAACKLLLSYPYLDINHVRSCAYTDNVASHRVHRKLGFRCLGVSNAKVPQPPSKGGGIREQVVFEWERGVSSDDSPGPGCWVCQDELKSRKAVIQ